jgi:hypothetical protein
VAKIAAVLVSWVSLALVVTAHFVGVSGPIALSVLFLFLVFVALTVFVRRRDGGELFPGPRWLWRVLRRR